MNDLKAASVLQKFYIDSAREGQVSLVSTHDVTNPPVHYCNCSLAYFGSKVLTIFTNNLKCMQVLFSNKTFAANYIANNLNNSHIDLCFGTLPNQPVDLLRIPFKNITCIL